MALTMNDNETVLRDPRPPISAALHRRPHVNGEIEALRIGNPADAVPRVRRPSSTQGQQEPQGQDRHQGALP